MYYWDLNIRKILYFKFSDNYIFKRFKILIVFIFFGISRLNSLITFFKIKGSIIYFNEKNIGLLIFLFKVFLIIKEYGFNNVL